MRYLLILMLVSFYVPSAIAYPTAAIRPLDHSAAAILTRAIHGSALVRAMLRELAETNVIVHLEMSRHLPSGIAGTTRFVASRGGHRYLRMSISSQLPADARVAMLGHELQHALEIARSAAHDVATLRQLWMRSGYRLNGEFFETTAALRVERQVRRELRAAATETSR